MIFWRNKCIQELTYYKKVKISEFEIIYLIELKIIIIHVFVKCEIDRLFEHCQSNRR